MREQMNSPNAAPTNRFLGIAAHSNRTAALTPRIAKTTKWRSVYASR
jgi:hypothetical protein